MKHIRAAFVALLMFAACSTQPWEAPNTRMVKDGSGKEIEVAIMASEVKDKEVYERLIGRAIFMNPCKHSGSWVPSMIMINRTGAGNWRLNASGNCANAFGVSDHSSYKMIVDSAFRELLDSSMAY